MCVVGLYSCLSCLLSLLRILDLVHHYYYFAGKREEEAGFAFLWFVLAKLSD